MSANTKNLSGYDRATYRSIIFHGKNSMTEMNLMMIGSTPLSQVTPKIVREEVAYGDGDLDLSRVDGTLYFEPRTITYTFVLADEYSAGTERTPVHKNKMLGNSLSAITKWLYQDYVDIPIKRKDIEPDTPLDPDAVIGYVNRDEMYDYAYGGYKFMKASVTEMNVSKVMLNDTWLESLEVTFTVDPYMQTFSGSKLDIATFVDRSITDRNVQTAMMIYNRDINNTNPTKDLYSYWLNDFHKWFSRESAVLLTGNTWRFTIRIPYSGDIGFRLAPMCSMSGVDYEISSATGQYTATHTQGDTVLNFLDVNYPGQIFTAHKGGYGYTQASADSAGHLQIRIDVTFVNTWTQENPPWIVFEWGVLRNFEVPQQNQLDENFFMDAYTKSDSAQLYINDFINPYYPWNFSTGFAIPESPYVELHIRNTQYDGMYKFRFDTTSRRL